MPKNNPFGYASKKMKKRVKKVRGTAGGNKGEHMPGMKKKMKTMKPPMKMKSYG